MSGAPQFATSPRNAAATLLVANAGRDGTGTVVTLFTASTNGARIDEISVKATVTTTAGMVRFWLHDGTNYFFWKELAVPAIVPSATVASFEATLGGLALILENGWSIRCAAEKAERFDVTISRGGEF